MNGLALSGGGVKGSYEIGAYYALKKCHVKIKGYSGTSIGAFNSAMLAAGLDKELLNFWQNAEVGEILGFDAKLLEKIKTKEIDFDYFKLSFKNFKNILENKGISTEGLKNILKMYDLEDKIRQRKIIYGLSTFRLNDFKPMNIFISDMKKGSLNNYILASCYLPIFKREKLEDNSYFFDGGIHDNCPVNMLISKGFKRIYGVDLGSLGINQKIEDKSKVVIIKPSRKLGRILELDKKRINDNIIMGYYDTLKVMNKYDGIKYTFRKMPKFYYTHLIKKIDFKLWEIAISFFKEKDQKIIIIKALEYLMEKDEMSYNKVYSFPKMLKKYYHNTNKSTPNKIINALKK